GSPIVQPTGTHVPASSGSEKQASIAAPVVTTAAPGGSDAGIVPVAAAPAGTTKKTPGFAIGMTLVAGLLVIVLHRK
ncbi:MAG: hypothetical protein Q7T80_18545, partial [Methanoregula sp.]|nr:hypothetical protein [Methanoregula sp.]